MSRRNMRLLLVFLLVGLACVLKTSRQGQVLVFAMNEIAARSLGPVEQEELFEGAMVGMTGRLDDYSSYISPKEREGFDELIDRKFGGVGIEIIIDPETKQLTVASPLVDTPAFEAGIRAGDRIVRIDGKATQGFSVEDAAELMRGAPGTLVTLTVLRPGARDSVDFEITRAVVVVNTVLGDTRNADGTWNYFLEGHDRIGYLRINSFADQTAGEMRRVMDWLVEHKLRGLILDLRNDPGGLLGAAIEICDMFLDKGVIVTTRGRDGSIREASYADGDGTYQGFPIAILVNKYTASASEIVAACLQDYKKAVIVGERTYGKGTVQELINLPGRQGMLKLTTASYWRPSNRNIHRGADAKESDTWGVSPDPDCEVKITDQQLDDLLLARQRRDISRANGPDGSAPEALPDSFDPQLNRAVEHVEGREKAAGGGERGAGSQSLPAGFSLAESPTMLERVSYRGTRDSLRLPSPLGMIECSFAPCRSICRCLWPA